MTPQEKAWLESHQELRLGFDTAWPPYDYVDTRGRHSGLAADVLARVGDLLGVWLVPQIDLSWPQVLTRVRERRLDVVSLCAPTPERAEYLSFSRPVVKVPWVIAGRNDGEPIRGMESLRDKTVLIAEGYAIGSVIRRHFPELTYIAAPTPPEALRMVSKGEADAYIGFLGSIDHIIKTESLFNVSVAAPTGLPPTKLSICVRSDWPELLSLVDKALQAIPPSDLQALLDKWTPAGPAPKPIEEPQAPAMASQTLLAFVALSVGLLLILSLIVFLLSKSKGGRDFSAFFGALGFRITVLAGLGVLVAVVAVLNWLAISESRDRATVRIENELQIVLNSSIERLNMWVADRSAFLAQLGRDPNLVGITRRLLAESRDPEALKASGALADARRFFASNELFDPTRFFIIAPDRISIGSRRDINTGTPNFVAETRPDLIDRAFKGEAVFVPPIRSDVMLEQANGDTNGDVPLTMFFAAPITDQTGRVLAVLTERVQPSGPLSAILHFGRIGESGETYAFNAAAKMVSESRFTDQIAEIGLIDGDREGGAEISLRDPGDDMTTGYRPGTSVTDLPLTLMASEALKLKELKGQSGRDGDVSFRARHQSNVLGYRDYRGVSVVGAWEWLSALELGVAVEMDYDEAYAGFYVFRRNLIVISAIATLLAIGATLFTLLVGQRAHRSLSQSRDLLEVRVQERTRELSEAYGVISDSIRYASSIQRAVLTSEQAMTEQLGEHLLLWEPRDVVGGDIYWCHRWGVGDLLILADCTGHGVPGAFMTLIATGALDRAMTEVVPGQVGALVQQVHRLVQQTLGQQGAVGESDDGLELGACYLHPGGERLTFAGARFPLFIVENGDVEEIRGTRAGIGYRGIDWNQEYAEHDVGDLENKTFYMTSDGMTDQVGGERRRMFGKKRLKALLLEIQDLPLTRQRGRLQQALLDYQGDEPRRDDLSVIGFRI